MSFDLKNIIVVGASAGGFAAIRRLLSKLDNTIQAVILIVIHISKEASAQIIVDDLQRNTSLMCKIATDGEELKRATVYLAPPDRHLMLDNNRICLTQGAYENRWRPSIDVLFRSAAVAYNARVIGIILSGMLDDGTAGMYAIKQSGGTCIIQEPEEAEFSGMPSNVLRKVDVDYQVPIDDIHYILMDIMSKPVKKDFPVPEEIRMETEITKRMHGNIHTLDQIGKRSPFVCPDCGGALWKLNEGHLQRYRCHTGHVYNEKVLLDEQLESLQESLWVSMRMMEERRNLLLSMADYDHKTHNKEEEDNKIERSEELNTHIERIKSLIISVNPNEKKDDSSSGEINGAA